MASFDRRVLRAGLVLLSLSLVRAGTASTAEAAASGPLQPEAAEVAVLPPAGPHRLLVGGDFRNGDVRVVDGDTGKLQGTFYARAGANLVVDPLGRYYYVAETSFAHGNRGARFDYISVYDEQLRLAGEVPIPGRLLAVTKNPTFDVSADGRLGYVFNMQPAASVSIVDLVARKLTAIVETPGCGMVYPWGPAGFAMLCGDGTLATVQRKKGRFEISRSAQFFDAERDPVFEESLVDRQSGRALFLSFTGTVYPVRLGEKPEFETVWTLTDASGLPPASIQAEHLAWRPGGSRLAAWHKATNRLYVLMHAGTHWTHKEPGSEVWVFDIAAHKRVARYPFGGRASSITVSQDEKPLLFVSAGGPEGPGGHIIILDAKTGEQLREAPGISGNTLQVHGF
jgi:methylamine dehydrogenase heavy chain